MSRRLMLKQPSSNTWDYEWNPSMGLLSENGFTIVSSGEATETMGTDGVILYSPSQGYISLRNPERFNKSVGVIECVVKLTRNTILSQNCRLCFANGTYGIQVSVGAKNSICLADSESYNNYTVIAPFQNVTDYKITLVLDNNVASVYINDQLIRSNIAVSDTLFPYSSNTAIWSQNQNGETIIESVRLKLGRV